MEEEAAPCPPSADDDAKAEACGSGDDDTCLREAHTHGSTFFLAVAWSRVQAKGHKCCAGDRKTEWFSYRGTSVEELLTFVKSHADYPYLSVSAYRKLTVIQGGKEYLQERLFVHHCVGCNVLRGESDRGKLKKLCEAAVLSDCWSK